MNANLEIEPITIPLKKGYRNRKNEKENMNKTLEDELLEIQNEINFDTRDI